MISRRAFGANKRVNDTMRNELGDGDGKFNAIVHDNVR
jgi:hypothetical protein